MGVVALLVARWYVGLDAYMGTGDPETRRNSGQVCSDTEQRAGDLRIGA